MADVCLSGVSKSFDDFQALQHIDLSIADGEFVAFVGPSGCGKSTLLRVIAGLEDITQGRLTIGGGLANDLPPAKRGVAMVFQSYALYPHMTVAENMAFGLKLAGIGKAEIDASVARAAEILQISHLLTQRPKQLSGGQRQRVAIGRAIVMTPKVFLFDEPLSNLDASLRGQMRIELTKLRRALKTTMIYVTHDQVEAMTLADRIVVLRKGCVEQVGAPLALYHHPQNLFVAGFMGSPRMNFLRGTLSGFTPLEASVTLEGGECVKSAVTVTEARVSDSVVLGIRPEHVGLEGSARDGVRAVVSFVERLGDVTLVHLTLDSSEELVARAIPEQASREGDVVYCQLPAAECHLFAANERAYPRTSHLELRGT